MKYQNKSNQLDHLLYSIVGITLAGTILSVLTLSLSSVHATSGTTAGSESSRASVSVAAACFMTANVDVPHSATLNGGTWSGGPDYYPDGIGRTTIQTLCNDASGFSIYAAGFTGDSMGGDNTVLRSSILGSAYDITTGTAQSGNTSNWAMKVTKVTDPSQSYGISNLSIQNDFDNVNYHVVPSNYTEVARYTTTTDATLGSKIETTYSAYIAAAQPAGTYTGKVKYTLVHPGGTDMPDVDTMQHVQYWGGSLAVGEERTVADIRDGKTYKVARLCTHYNGENCDTSQIWMTQNLDLCIGCTGTLALTSENTDLNTASSGIYTNGYSVDGNEVITWTPAGNGTVTGTPATITFMTGGQANTVSGWTNDTASPYMAEGGDTNYVAENVAYTTKSDCETAQGAETCAHGQVGNYYNWTAAVASNASGSITTKFADAANSICPAGWRLPDGPDGTNGSEFNTLLSANGIANGIDNGSGSPQNVGFKDGGRAKIEGLPYYFGRYGSLSGNTFWSLSTYGYYWSSSIVSSDKAFNLAYGSSNLYPAFQDTRGIGYNIRCVAR